MSISLIESSEEEPHDDSEFESLRAKLAVMEQSTGVTEIGVCFQDLENDLSFSYKAERWFHAASTVKLPILVGVYSAIHRNALHQNSRLHVRNRFHSALDGVPFTVAVSRDSNSEVHAAIGKTMRVCDLAHHMIVTSSNLAANLLLDVVGVAEINAAMSRFNVQGLDVVRGVEDDRAFQAGLNNRVTAKGLVQLLRVIVEEQAFSRELSQEMVDILHKQEFKRGIPAELPPEVHVAHKTGKISTVSHDAGIVFVPGRRPYVLSVLTEWPQGSSGRSSIIAAISREVYETLCGKSADA